MIQLTTQQWQEVGKLTVPAKIVDPATKDEFILIRADAFAELQGSVGNIEPRDSYAAIDRAFAPGWDDPKMADYDNYEQNKR